MRIFPQRGSTLETYQVFGLTLKSALSLPCLPSAGEGAPEIEIVFGAVRENGLEDPVEADPYSQSKPGQVWLRIPGAARFLITGGNQILIDPESGADGQTLRLFVLGSCMGAILHQRGCLVLHGSALRFGDQCVVFVGDSGAGKSTTAAALHLRGHDILADDISVIDSQGRVQPGFPQMKLWAATADLLGLDTGALARIRPQADKYAFPVDEGFCDRALPLAAVFVLRTHEKPDLLVETVRGMEKMNLLIQHTYRFGYVRGMGLQPRHLMQCGRLANLVPITAVTRPMAGLTLEAWLERMEDYLPRLPAGGVTG
jgi:hypothetical protein